jgi:hypothetical protein
MEFLPVSTPPGKQRGHPKVTAQDGSNRIIKAARRLRALASGVEASSPMAIVKVGGICSAIAGTADKRRTRSAARPVALGLSPNGQKAGDFHRYNYRMDVAVTGNTSTAWAGTPARPLQRRSATMTTETSPRSERQPSTPTISTIV